MPPNKSRLQGRFAPGRPYGRPSLKRWAAIERWRLPMSNLENVDAVQLLVPGLS